MGKKSSRRDADYHYEDGVYVLDEHELTDDAGRVLMKVDANRLKQIADRNNRRIRKTGDEVPLVIGHTKDDAPESEQPELVGYASNFRVVPFFKTGRKAIAATFKFLRDKVDKVRNFPRRSVELWLNDLKLDPIALLGATTPERDLGLLRLSRDGRRKYRRLMGNPVDEKEIVNKVLAALKETDVFKWVESQMQKDMESQDDGDMGDVLPGEDDLGPEPDPGMDDVSADPGVGAGGKGDDEDPQRYEAGYPSAGNTFAPGDMSGKRTMSRRDRDVLVKMQRENEMMLDSLEDLRIKYQRTRREKDMIRLEAEGYMFDIEEELDDVQDMDEPRYQRHLLKMRQRYQKSPTARTFDYSQSRSGQKPSGREAALAAVEYATKHGVSYEDARAALSGEATY